MSLVQTGVDLPHLISSLRGLLDISVHALIQSVPVVSIGPLTIVDTELYCRDHGMVMARTTLGSWLEFDKMVKGNELCCDCGRPLTREQSRIILLTDS